MILITGDLHGEHDIQKFPSAAFLCKNSFHERTM